MTTHTSLESMLEGAVRNLADSKTSPTEREPEPASEPASAEPDKAAAPAADGTGAKDGSPPSHDDKDIPNDVQGLRSATIGERKRRQEAEQKNAELERRLKEIEGRPAQAAAPATADTKQQPTPPDPWLDPEGYMRFQQAQQDDVRFADRVELSQELMRSKHEDYDAVEQVFIEECKTNPFLRSQLRTAPFPARLAYEQGKKLMALREIGDPVAYRAKIEAELKAKFEAEQAASAAPAAPPVQSAQPKASVPPAPPPSLAGVTSAAPRKAAAKFEGPTPLEKILN